MSATHLKMVSAATALHRRYIPAAKAKAPGLSGQHMHDVLIGDVDSPQVSEVCLLKREHTFVTHVLRVTYRAGESQEKMELLCL